jgi:hypothetical protein
MEYPPRFKPLRCIDCGKTGLYLSKKGLCEPCGIKRNQQAIKDMRNKTGVAYENWKKSMALFLVRELKD